MGNKFTPEEAYSRLGHLITEMPDLDARPISSDTVQWLARVVAAIEATGDPQAHTITYETQRLGATFSPDAARRIELHLKTALQRVELQLPVDARGSFIPAGNTFDAFAAVASVFQTAKKSVLIVDPYADEKVFDFVTTCDESVMIKVLADQADHKPSLKPAAERWTKQWGSKRRFEARLSPPKALHDRLFIVDGVSAYEVGQSLNRLATRAHTSINKVTDPDIASRKIAAHKSMWSNATHL